MPADDLTPAELAIATGKKRAAAQAAVLDQPELPEPQLLVESAQGFVEGWTRSQVRSAINLALLKQRYEPDTIADQPAQAPVLHGRLRDAAAAMMEAEFQTAPLRRALELIGTPIRADGTWNHDRSACRRLALQALEQENKQ